MILLQRICTIKSCTNELYSEVPEEHDSLLKNELCIELFVDVNGILKKENRQTLVCKKSMALFRSFIATVFHTDISMDMVIV